MRITRQDMQARIGAAYQARIKAFDSQRSSMAVEPQDVYEVHRQYEALVADGLSVGIILGLLILDIFAFIGGLIVGGEVGLFAGAAVWGATIALNVGLGRWLSKRSSTRRHKSDVVRLVLPLAGTSDVEKQYARALLELMRDDSPLGESASRELLGQLNALLESGYEIADQRERIGSAAIKSGLAELEASRNHLAARIAMSSDTEAREILQQSLAICEARLDRAKALSPLEARLEAQQEMIQQTIASVAEALAGMKLGSAAVMPPLEAINETVGRIQGQTKAVEQAVREVMSLRAGG